jgi:AmmeMemoRadiSam system protein A
VASCDFTHHGPRFGYTKFRTDVRKGVEELDRGAIDLILKRDGPGFWKYVRSTGATICGRCPVRILLHLLPDDAKGELVNYYTSGDVTGDHRESVSYAAIVFTAKGQWGKAAEAKPEATDAEPESTAGISEAGQKRLLEIARKSLEAVTAGKPVPEFELSDPELQGHYGVFVTLMKGGRLRGCIGNFRPPTPVYRTVAAQARESALKDPRFRPVTQDEVKDISIEISVLLPPKVIKDPLDWELGKHGILIQRVYRGRFHSGTYLPQVAEHFKTKEEMLSSCCASKARLPANAWRDPQTTVKVYEARVFGEESAK